MLQSIIDSLPTEQRNILSGYRKERYDAGQHVAETVYYGKHQTA